MDFLRALGSMLGGSWDPKGFKKSIKMLDAFWKAEKEQPRKSGGLPGGMRGPRGRYRGGLTGIWTGIWTGV